VVNCFTPDRHERRFTTDSSLEVCITRCKATSSEINELDNDIMASHTIKEEDVIILNELSDRSKPEMLCQERQPRNVNMLTYRLERILTMVYVVQNS
jgi:hypothetical protein